MVRGIAAFVLSVVSCGLSFGQEQESEEQPKKVTVEVKQEITITERQRNKLADMVAVVEAMANLKQHQPDYGKDHDILKAKTLSLTEKKIGVMLTWEQLVEASKEPPGIGDKIAGYFTWLNIIKITAALILVVALCWLFRLYFAGLIISLPAQVWELLIYLGCASLIYFSRFGDLAQYDYGFGILIAFPGCVGLYGAAWFSYWLHGSEQKPSDLAIESVDSTFSNSNFEYGFPHDLVWTVLAVVWGAVAIWCGSSVIGFISVLAMMMALGFNAGLLPGVMYFGYDEDDAIYRGTLAALVCLVIYVVCTIANVTDPSYAVVFAPGLSVLGTFVYFLGLLILANKHYAKGSNYFLFQFVTIISGVAAMYIGVLPGI